MLPSAFSRTLDFDLQYSAVSRYSQLSDLCNKAALDFPELVLCCVLSLCLIFVVAAEAAGT